MINSIKTININKYIHKRTIESKIVELSKSFSVIMLTRSRKIWNGGVICMKSELFPIDKNNNYIPLELI